MARENTFYPCRVLGLSIGTMHCFHNNHFEQHFINTNKFKLLDKNLTPHFQQANYAHDVSFDFDVTRLRK